MNPIKKIRNLAAGIAVLLGGSAFLACSADKQADPAGNPVDSAVADRSEALSADESCDENSANKRFTSKFSSGGFVSPSSYGVSWCEHAYRIDIDSLDLDSTAWDMVEDAGTVPTTRSACEKLRTGAYAWRRNANGTTTFLDSVWEWAKWTGGECVVPSISLQKELRVTENGAAYRIAASARNYSVAGDSSSGFTKRSLRMIRVPSPVTDLAIQYENCFENALWFRSASSYRGRSMPEYVLYRDGARVVQRVPATVNPGDGPRKILHDMWFTPDPGSNVRYSVAAIDSAGQESPPSAIFSFASEFCDENDGLERVVIIPTIPAGLPAEQIASNERIEEIIFETSNDIPSVEGYYQEVTSGWWTPDFDVPEPLHLDYPLQHYTDLMGGVLLSAPTWDSACNDDFTCDCIRPEMPCSCAPEAGGLRIRCESFTRSTLEDNEHVAELRAAHRAYREDTKFVFVVMGMPSGGAETGEIVVVGGGSYLPGKTFFQAIGSLVHELGHSLNFQHAGGYSVRSNDEDCDVSNDALFGSLFGIGNCHAAEASDYVDPMGRGSRPYSALARRASGWLVDTNVATYHPLTDSQKEKNVKLHSRSGRSGNVSLIQLFTDDASSALYLEYRADVGYNSSAFIGATDAFVPGVFPYFRAGKSGGPPVAMHYAPHAATSGAENRSILDGEVVQLDDVLGITVSVSNMTTTSADVQLTWR